MNRNEPMVWEAVKRSAALLKEQNIKYVLMGTAGLAAHGIKPSNVPDVDFLVASPVLTVPGTFEPHVGGNGSKDTGTFLVPTAAEPVKVDFVLADRPIEKGFLEEISVEIDGILVMNVDNLLGIKRWKGRAKDVAFLKLLGEDAVEAADPGMLEMKSLDLDAPPVF